jgi:hypothetical protein
VKSKANLMFKKALFLVFSLIISIAYSDEPFEKGKVIERVYCLNDSTQSYALYLPSTYSSDQQWPIIYLFEPASRAKLPPFNRLSVDKKRMYTSGFSGGSRLATMVAMLVDDISGVIACGAGFPYDQAPTKDISFSYFGIVGRLDMNFQEMLQLEKDLYNLCIVQHFEYYMGDHDWPPTEIFQSAFFWLETNAMRNDLVPKNEKLITEIKSNYYLELEGFSDIIPNFYSYNITKKYNKLLSGLADVTLYINENRCIFFQSKYKSELLELEKITETERAYQQKFNEEFRQISLTAFKEDYSVLPLSWWKNEIKKLQSNETDKALTLEDEMFKRLLNFLLLVSWEEYQNFYTQERYETAIKFMEISELAGPDKAWVNYLLAKAYAQAVKNKQALKQLNEAVIKGYNRINVLENDEAFVKIRDNKKYKEIIEEMKIIETLK